MASQLHGGAYMPSQAAPPPPPQQAPATAPQTPAKPIGRLGKPINQELFKDRVSLRSVTVKQISDAAAAQLPRGERGEYPLLDGVPLSYFKLVGKLTYKFVGDTYWQVKIDDGTGSIDLVHEGSWGETEQWPLSNVNEGQYVSVHGQVTRQWSGAARWRTLAWCVAPVGDHNEVTHHFLRVIMEHSHLLFRQRQQQGAGGQGPPVGGQWAPAPAGGRQQAAGQGPSQAQWAPGQGGGGGGQGPQTPGQARWGGQGQGEPSHAQAGPSQFQLAPGQGGPSQGGGGGQAGPSQAAGGAPMWPYYSLE